MAGLPFYGSWPAQATSVPGGGWARELNVWTTRRMAAGLGARTVRHNQEALMAAAWDQLGEVREAADELNRARLGAEVARTRQAGLAAVESGDRIALAAPLLTFVRVGSEPARAAIASGRAPTGLMDRAWLRRAPRARGASAASRLRRGDPGRRERAGAGRVEVPAGGALRGSLRHGHRADRRGPVDRLLGAETKAYVEQTGLATRSAEPRCTSTWLAAASGRSAERAADAGHHEHADRTRRADHAGEAGRRDRGRRRGCAWRVSIRSPPRAPRSSPASPRSRSCCRPASCRRRWRSRPSSPTRCSGTSPSSTRT